VAGGGHDAPASHKPGGGHEEEHEEHVNHEAWVIPYADMLTLLMALFLMLWATSSSDEAKFAALADSLREAFGNGTGENELVVTVGGAGFLEGQESGVTGGDLDVEVKKPTNDELTTAALAGPQNRVTKADQAMKREQEKAALKKAEDEELKKAQEQIAASAAAAGVAGEIKFRREERGLVVTIVTDNVLFESGSSVLEPKGQSIVRLVTEVLRNVPNDVVVEGHTDNSPIKTFQYPSNWELSSLRGTAVLRFMIERVNYDANRIAASGFGETRPVDTNDTAAGRAANRRVEIVVLAEVE